MGAPARRCDLCFDIRQTASVFRRSIILIARSFWPSALSHRLHVWPDSEQDFVTGKDLLNSCPAPLHIVRANGIVKGGYQEPDDYRRPPRMTCSPRAQPFPAFRFLPLACHLICQNHLSSILPCEDRSVDHPRVEVNLPPVHSKICHYRPGHRICRCQWKGGEKAT